MTIIYTKDYLLLLNLRRVDPFLRLRIAFSYRRSFSRLAFTFSNNLLAFISRETIILSSNFNIRGRVGSHRGKKREREKGKENINREFI